MKDFSKDSPPGLEMLTQKIQDLEQRMERLEKRLLQPDTSTGDLSYNEGEEFSFRLFEASNRKEGSIETHMGEYGMAWMGNIVLLTGILFLTQLLRINDHIMLSHALGFLSVAVIYTAARFTGQSLPLLSRLFNYNGHILLFISAMRLHVLGKSQVIESDFLGYGSVLVVLLALLYLGFRNRSQLLMVIVLIMAVILGVAANTTHLTLPILLGITAASTAGVLKNQWWTGMILSVILVYLTFLMWIMGNPIVNGSIGFIPQHQMGHIYLFIIALVYSGLALLPVSDSNSESCLKTSIVLNGLGFSFIMALAALAFFKDTHFIYFGLIAAFCLGYAVLLKSQDKRAVIASMYAIYCFVALSITIAGIYQFPIAFFLLSVESLLVVSIALWFRSKFIVRMNTLLFAGLLITYLATPEPVPIAHFSFALVSFITARILNWKKQRLEIRTEHIRNLYLLIGTGVLLHALHLSVPDQYITLSWAMAAVLFFILSLVMRNIKYRWLAIATMVLTVFYLFLIDLSNISLGTRIIALLFISIISLGISVYYTRRLRTRDEAPQEAGES
jgi:hypothetical protein